MWNIALNDHFVICLWLHLKVNAMSRWDSSLNARFKALCLCTKRLFVAENRYQSASSKPRCWYSERYSARKIQLTAFWSLKCCENRCPNASGFSEDGMPATDRLFLLQALLKDAPMFACIKVSSRRMEGTITRSRVCPRDRKVHDQLISSKRLFQIEKLSRRTQYVLTSGSNPFPRKVSGLCMHVSCRRICFRNKHVRLTKLVLAGIPIYGVFRIASPAISDFWLVFDVESRCFHRFGQEANGVEMPAYTHAS